MNLLFIFMLLASGEPEFVPSHPQIEEIDPSVYVVGPGDIFWFTVPGGIPDEISDTDGSSILYMTVTPDGYLVIPSAGAWYVSGLSLGEAVYLVETGFSIRFPGLRGMAGLASLRTFRVPVTGQVGSPGIYEITGAHRLTDLLRMAGGIAPAGAWTSVEIAHSHGDTSIMDISLFLLQGSMLSNPPLSLGDRIHVPQATHFLRIEGAVRLSGLHHSEFNAEGMPVWTASACGILEFISGEKVSELVTRAGGTESWAQRDSCYILRETAGGQDSIIPAPLNDPGIDPLLQPDDRVICPGLPPVVAVSGYVHSPGVYPYTAGMDGFFYISQAGGLLREASGSGTRIVLPDGEEKRMDELRVVPAGSSIVIPRKVLVWWQDPLLIVTGIASVIIAWKSIF